MHLGYRQSWRARGSPALTPVIDVGEQFVQRAFLRPGTLRPPFAASRCGIDNSLIDYAAYRHTTTTVPAPSAPTFQSSRTGSRA